MPSDALVGSAFPLEGGPDHLLSSASGERGCLPPNRMEAKMKSPSADYGGSFLQATRHFPEALTETKLSRLSIGDGHSGEKVRRATIRICIHRHLL